MPGKARRVASRQAQLSRRRKRQQNRPEDGVATVSETKTEEHGGQQASSELSAAPESPLPESPAVDAPETPTPPVRPTPRPPRPPRPSPVAARSADAESASTRSGAGRRRERLPVNNNIGTEIRRILAMSGTVLAVIIVLGIVL